MMGCVGPMGGGTYCVQEQFNFYDPYDEASVRASLEFQRAAKKALAEKGYHTGAASDPPSFKPKEEAEAVLVKILQPVVPYMQYQIKQALDPNGVSAPGYTQLSIPPVEKE